MKRFSFLLSFGCLLAVAPAEPLKPGAPVDASKIVLVSIEEIGVVFHILRDAFFFNDSLPLLLLGSLKGLGLEKN